MLQQSMGQFLGKKKANHRLWYFPFFLYSLSNALMVNPRMQVCDVIEDLTLQEVGIGNPMFSMRQPPSTCGMAGRSDSSATRMHIWSLTRWRQVLDECSKHCQREKVSLQSNSSQIEWNKIIFHLEAKNLSCFWSTEQQTHMQVLHRLGKMG